MKKQLILRSIEKRKIFWKENETAIGIQYMVLVLREARALVCLFLSETAAEEEGAGRFQWESYEKCQRIMNRVGTTLCTL
jgi:hypothetical protein